MSSLQLVGKVYHQFCGHLPHFYRQSQASFAYQYHHTNHTVLNVTVYFLASNLCFQNSVGHYCFCPDISTAMSFEKYLHQFCTYTVVKKDVLVLKYI
jgi:hypothetical protein